MFERAGKRNSDNKEFQFWRQDNHSIELSSPGMLKQKLDYLHDNSVRADIVFRPQPYVYSCAVDYCTKSKEQDVDYAFTVLMPVKDLEF